MLQISSIGTHEPFVYLVTVAPISKLGQGFTNVIGNLEGGWVSTNHIYIYIYTSHYFIWTHMVIILLDCIN